MAQTKSIFWRRLVHGGRIGKFIITSQIITALTRLIDVGMIYYIVSGGKYGAVKAFLFMTPLNIILSMAIVYVVEWLLDKGHDVTGVEELRSMENKSYSSKQWIKRFVQWIIKRKVTIFWIGSWYYIDPDYVTLLIRERERGFWFNSFYITIPSVLLAMIVWTPVYWLAFRGVQWAIRFAGF